MNNQGKSRQAIDYYRQALESKPDYPDANRNLGLALNRLADFEQDVPRLPVELARQLCETDGYKSPRLLTVLAAAQADAGKFPEAIQTAEKALALVDLPFAAVVVGRLAPPPLGVVSGGKTLPRRDSVLQLKQPRQGVQQHVRDAMSRFVAERFQRRMQQLVQQPIERATDLRPLPGVQLRQLAQQPLQLLFLRLPPALLELPDHRAGRPVIRDRP